MMNTEKEGSDCFVCGRLATTEEHIFPKWLQRKYDLWNQTIRLPNDTEIKYRQLTIPCCLECNGIYLSQLEDAVMDGTATESQLWKWALKIHLGLLSKHTDLWWNRRERDATLADVLNNEQNIALEQELVGTINGTFSVSPNPFGSVFKFQFAIDEGYHFTHLLNPSGMMFCLGRVGYVIFVKDTGSLGRTTSLKPLIRKTQEDATLGKVLNFFANCWIHLYRFRATYPHVRTHNSIVLLGVGKLVEERPFTDEQFQLMWSILNGAPFAAQLADGTDMRNGVSKDTPVASSNKAVSCSHSA
jgi:hypothetical protein